MFKKVMSVLASSLVVAVLTFGVAGLVPATSVSADAKTEVTKGITSINDGNTVPLGNYVKSIINVLLFIVGAVAVIVIIVGGISYVVSAGDPAKVKKAKDTILYAVVGLVVALLAFAIIRFVTDSL